jgi:hypothetical protein
MKSIRHMAKKFYTYFYFTSDSFYFSASYFCCQKFKKNMSNGLSYKIMYEYS